VDNAVLTNDRYEIHSQFLPQIFYDSMYASKIDVKCIPQSKTVGALGPTMSVL
jgi:hypothetical protein